MPDINMSTAYSWAARLADTYQLKLSLDLPKVTELVIRINEILGAYISMDIKSKGSGLFENFPESVKDIILNRIDDLCRSYLNNQMNENQRKSIGLRLWSGCLSAAKTIALETMDGVIDANMRRKIFDSIDKIANSDLIFRTGVESAPLFKKHHQQCYSFNGVPSSSAVREYPNEYLIE